MILNKEYLRQVVKNGINECPTKAVLFREVADDYGEVKDYEQVAELDGQLYSRNVAGNAVKADGGAYLLNRESRFITVFCPESEKAEVGDVLVIGRDAHEITALGDTNNIYFDFSLVRSAAKPLAVACHV